MIQKFIDSSYNVRFFIPTSGKVKACRYDGSPSEVDDVDDAYPGSTDEYHVKVGRRVYHICQLAELQEMNGYEFRPLYDTKYDDDTFDSLLNKSLSTLRAQEKEYEHLSEFYEAERLAKAIANSTLRESISELLRIKSGQKCTDDKILRRCKRGTLWELHGNGFIDDDTFRRYSEAC